MHALRAARDAAGLGHRDEELQIDQIETHGGSVILMVRRRAFLSLRVVSNHEARGPSFETPLRGSSG